MNKDKKEFIKELNEDLEKFVEHSTLSQLEDKSNIQVKAQIFYSAYYAKKLAEYTRWLIILTAIITLMAMLQISNAWIGEEATMAKFMKFIRELISIIILIFIGYAFFYGIYSSLKKIYYWNENRKK